MIICFSGTGNSRMVADTIQKITDEDVVRFAPGLFLHPEFIKLDVPDDRVLWVTPVYAWTLPRFAMGVMKHARLITKNPIEHHLILTCGDDIGYADNVWRKLIKSRGWNAGSVFSVQMPNTFVGLKGFDVDPADVAERKLAAVPDRVADIVDTLEQTGPPVTDVVRGAWPHVKTGILSPLFHKVLMRPAKLHVTDACTGCGRCSRNCPAANIMIEGGRPHFGDNCTLCFRCYHLCRQHALHYGKASMGKGQYVCPTFTPNP